jgi:hypothetical protein
MAVDGNMATRWSSAFADPQWIYVDLGDTYLISRVKIFWEAAFGKDYRVEFSDDASTWTTIKTVTANSSTVNDHFDVSGSARYVRIYGTSRATPWGYSIYELEVYGTSNQAPVADAGSDMTIHLPDNIAVINGSGTDSDGSITSYAWTVESAPNSPTLVGDNTESITVSGLVSGVYVFSLTVTDNNGATGFDDVSVLVNARPYVNAGIDRIIGLPVDTVTLKGSASDVDGEIISYQWTKESGPNDPTLTNDSTGVLTVSDLMEGTYVFRLAATDNHGAVVSDEVILVVYPNTTPMVSAGPDVEVTWPINSVSLQGSASDSLGFITEYQWTLESGPNVPTLSDTNSSLLSADNLLPGTYTFRLTVVDNGGLTAFDETTVVVNYNDSLNIALLRPVMVSSIQNSNTPGAAAVDGDVATAWTSGSAERQWISVDLGALYQVNRVEIIWQVRLGKHYDIEVSTDGISWTTVKSVKANKNLVNEYVQLSNVGRYIRIDATKSGGHSGYSIAEFEVYGRPIPSSSRLQFEHQEIQSTEVDFYPNPGRDIVHVNGLKNGDEVCMTSATGFIRYKKTVINESIDINDIPAGLYIVDCNNGIRKKVIKE